ncbi:MAG: hypothetical protein QOH13_488, partial [Thermoleophilaceae bacterium]|nr:hypothetical protein [Thermoleophilaceae bacterium]
MRAPLVTVAILALALPAGASAQQSQPHEKAQQKHVHQTKGVKTGFERSGAILARPDDTAADPQDTHKWSGLEAAGSPHCTPHFCVHWTGTGSDGSDAAHADQMKDILENEVFPCENTTAPTACAGSPGLGWRLPASDGTLGGDARTDVYIENLYDSEKVFGYVATDPGQPQDPSVAHYAYMVLDKDYTRYAGGDAAGGLVAEQVTAAHEYNHILQNAYDYLEDSWMFEATAVYMEDKVYPQDNDYLHYVPAWATNPHQPLTAFSNQNLKPYGSAVWNHWLDHRFGSGVVRSAWESSVGSADFAPAAYSAAIGAAGGAGFSDEFDRFSAAVAEWNAPGSGFPDPYPDVVRDGTLPAGSQTSPFGLAHTTFALFEVPVPSDSPPVIRLTATLPAGTSGAIALVGRTGADPAAGTVTSNLTPMPAGGFGAVQLDNPAAFGRITAVVVNSDASKAGFDFTADDYVFTKDAQDVVATVIEPGVPIPVTGPAKSIADHAASITGSVDPHLIDTTWTIEYGRTSSYGSSTAPQPVAGSTLG